LVLDKVERCEFEYKRHGTQTLIWFSILARKLLRRGNFASKSALRTKIEQFIAYFNETMAKPFHWTMEARPLAG
jgi:hypothetical protein